MIMKSPMKVKKYKGNSFIFLYSYISYTSILLREINTTKNKKRLKNDLST